MEGIADLIPDMSDIEHGSIQKEYPCLGLWEVGQQLLQGSKVFMRKYSVPQLDEAEDSEVDEINVPHLGEVYRVRTLIPMINLCSYDPLTRWSRSRDYVRVTEFRSKEVSSTYKLYRPTREEIEPPTLYDMKGIELPKPAALVDIGSSHKLSTGSAIAWGPDKKIVQERELTFTLGYGESLEVQLYGEEVLEVSHSPGPRGKDEDDDVLIQAMGIGTPPGYDVPINFPNDPTREKVMMKGLVGRGKGWV